MKIKTAIVLGLIALMLGAGVVPSMTARNIHVAIPCEAYRSPFDSLYDEIPVEGCGLAGVTIDDVESFYYQHQTMLDALETTLIEGGVEAFIDIVMETRGDDITLSDDLIYLINEFHAMVVCSEGDKDGDGIPDFEDPDDDNDGIPDDKDNCDITQIKTKYPDYLTSFIGTKYYFWTDNPDTEKIAFVWDRLGAGVTYIVAEAVFGGPSLGVIPALVLAQSVATLWLKYKIFYGTNAYEVANTGYGTISTGWIDEDETIGSLLLGIPKVYIDKQEP